jgi:hypothetical protein
MPSSQGLKPLAISCDPGRSPVGRQPIGRDACSQANRHLGLNLSAGRTGRRPTGGGHGSL